MYKLMLVTDQEDVREAFKSFPEWGKLGFEEPLLLSDVEEAKRRLNRQEADAVAYLLPKDAGQDFFTFLSTHQEIVGMEAAGDHARLRREIGITRRTLVEREQEADLDDVLPMLQADFFHTILQGTHFEAADLDRRVEMLQLQIRPQWPVCLLSMRMPQGERFLDEVWRYGSERLENALRNIFERDEPDMSYVLQVLNPHHMRLLAYPKTQMTAGEVELHTKNHMLVAKEDLKEFFDLDMEIRKCIVYESLYALCAQEGEN